MLQSLKMCFLSLKNGLETQYLLRIMRHLIWALSTQRMKHSDMVRQQTVLWTLEITKVLNKDLKRHNLAALSRYYNVELVSHHRAIYDAEATGYIFIKMLQQLKEAGITKHNELNTLAREDAYKLGLPDHATILVKSQEGLKNLFKIVSDSLTTSFYQV